SSICIMSDINAKYLAEAKQYWERFEGRVQESVNEYLSAGYFDGKTFTRYVQKLSRRYGVDISESEIEATRVVLTENVKTDVRERMDGIAENMKFISKFAEIFELTENASESDKVAIRNMQNPQMDMAVYKLEPTVQYADQIEEIAAMYEEMNKNMEEELVGVVDEMAELRDWINKEIERRTSEKRNAHSERNERRANPRRRSSLGTLNTTLSRRSIDHL
ncbi:hypothetical protein PMAYCL1PPCAC_24441, partial [Pristionchus mayeri]